MEVVVRLLSLVPIEVLAVGVAGMVVIGVLWVMSRWEWEG